MSEFDHVEDSGEREDFSTGSVRDTREGKGRFDLLPTILLRRLAKHYENGAKKYGDHNWKMGQPLSRYLDSAFRHLVAVMENLQDEDHAAAVIWNITSYMWTMEEVRAGRLDSKLDDVGAVGTSLTEQLEKMRAQCARQLEAGAAGTMGHVGE